MSTEYTPRTLTEAIKQLPTPKSLLYDLVFGDRRQSFAELTEFEIETGPQTLSSFVARGREGIVRSKNDKNVVVFHIPEIREKKPFRAAELLRNRPSTGTYVNAGDLQRAMDQQVASELQEFKNAHTRTKEWMCAQALQGSLSIVTDDGNLDIDYGVPAANKVTYSGQAAWGASLTTDIPGQLDDLKNLVAKCGFGADTLILGSEAAKRFKRNKNIIEYLKSNNLVVGRLDLTKDPNYLGTYERLNIYQHDQTYMKNGVETSMFPSNVAVVLASKAPFRFYHGPIDDVKAGLQPVEFFSKSFETEDPSAIWLLVATAPVPMICNANSLAVATVC